MPSNNKAGFAALMLLAGCGGGRGYGDAPVIALPPERGAAPVPYPVADPNDAPLPEVGRGGGPGAGYVAPPEPLPADPPPQDAPPDLSQTGAPRGTSGEQRYDTVGYAGVVDTGSPGVTVSHATLSPGSYVEMTALDSGRTIVALVDARGVAGGRIAGLSPGAAQALGVADGAPIRIRLVVPTPQDQAALRSGQAASPRIDTPPVLLVALRKRLAGAAPSPLRPATRVPIRPATARKAPVAPGTGHTGGYVVQVATLSTAPRAAALAGSTGGHVVAGGGLYRVQLGPFADAATAKRARDDVARRGYADARLIHSE